MRAHLEHVILNTLSVMQLQIFLSPVNGVSVRGMALQIRGKTRKSAIQLIFRGG